MGATRTAVAEEDRPEVPGQDIAPRPEQGTGEQGTAEHGVAQYSSRRRQAEAAATEAESAAAAAASRAAEAIAAAARAAEAAEAAAAAAARAAAEVVAVTAAEERAVASADTTVLAVTAPAPVTSTGNGVGDPVSVSIAPAWSPTRPVAVPAWSPDAPGPDPTTYPRATPATGGRAARRLAAEVASNGAAVNGVAGNGVAGNGVAGNGVAGNGAAGNGAAGNGAAGNGVAGNGLNGHGIGAVHRSGPPTAGDDVVTDGGHDLDGEDVPEGLGQDGTAAEKRTAGIPVHAGEDTAVPSAAGATAGGRHQEPTAAERTAETTELRVVDPQAPVPGSTHEAEAEPVAVEQPEAVERPPGRRADRRRAKSRRIRPAFAAAAAGGVVVVAVVVAAFAGSAPVPSPAAVDGAAATTADAGAPTSERAARPVSSGRDSTAIPRRGDVDLTSEKAVAYLAGLREADIPTSRSGLAETETAAVICEQLAGGAEEAALVRALPAVLPTVTRSQAAVVVDNAQEHYC